MANNQILHRDSLATVHGSRTWFWAELLQMVLRIIAVVAECVIAVAAVVHVAFAATWRFDAGRRHV